MIISASQFTNYDLGSLKGTYLIASGETRRSIRNRDAVPERDELISLVIGPLQGRNRVPNLSSGFSRRYYICAFQARMINPKHISQGRNRVPVPTSGFSRRYYICAFQARSINPRHISHRNRSGIYDRIHASRLQRALSCDAPFD